MAVILCFQPGHAWNPERSRVVPHLVDGYKPRIMAAVKNIESPRVTAGVGDGLRIGVVLRPVVIRQYAERDELGIVVISADGARSP